MRRVSKKRQKLMDVAGPWRYDFCGQIGRCEYCLRQRGPDYLCCHEIANGNGLRQKALMAPYAILVMCREPNFQEQSDCHATVQRWPEPKQLALLYAVDQGRFDLKAYIKLTSPHAPKRITWPEVDACLREVYQTFNHRPQVAREELEAWPGRE